MNPSGLDSSFIDFHNARAAAAPTNYHWAYIGAGVVLGSAFLVGVGAYAGYKYCGYKREVRKVGDMGQPLIPLNPANAQGPAVPNYGAVPPPQN
ncbi:hypothetical protein CAEBREN_22251 [Caenorhabditis brenneri]|uniref:Uncharacterized protein n=1 Tax=Caenorhabditis brenneri TaxID=135651 RepID=G0NTP2_CAEBE|nr:hypothetical protein CAEBREN_22251 [Caenorhabditis brenneri]